MKLRLLILSFSVACLSVAIYLPGNSAAAQSQSQAPTPPSANSSSLMNDLANARKAHALIEQAIQALGGQAWLNIHDMESEGRTYSFHHGTPTSNGLLYWRFVEYPDKERVELTQQRDVAELYVGNKGYEITFKGPHEIEKKDLDDYLRRRRLSLENILRNWINDPTVALFYDGNALAGNLAAVQVTLINTKDEAVHICFDPDTHLPLKKSYQWRDPVDKERDFEEEIYDNYRSVQGVMIPYGFTRYYNGDMQSQRFLNAAHINQTLDEAMFDPNSNYDPNKVASNKKKRK